MDKSTYDRIIETHEGYLYAYAISAAFHGSSERFDTEDPTNDAEDAVHEAVLEILSGGLESMNDEKHVVASLVLRIEGRLKDRRRRRRTFLRIFKDGLRKLRFTDDEPPERQLLRQHDRSTVRAAIERLHEPYKTTICLHYLEGYKMKEVAEQMECPINTIKTRVRRALELLRNDLDDPFDRAGN